MNSVEEAMFEVPNVDPVAKQVPAKIALAYASTGRAARKARQGRQSEDGPANEPCSETVETENAARALPRAVVASGSPVIPPNGLAPHQLRTISQRVYELIVDQVRRERERKGR